MIEADTVAHCGPPLIGEFARTLTMTDIVTGWTENCSIRNNAAKWILAGVEQQEWFPFEMVIFDSDCVLHPLLDRGHKSATMALDLYGHLMGDRRDVVADALDACPHGGAGPSWCCLSVAYGHPRRS